MSSPAAATGKSGERRLLDPVDRVSEILFGLIMALTFTCTLSVADAEWVDVRTMLIGAWAASWPGAWWTPPSSC